MEEQKIDFYTLVLKDLEERASFEEQEILESDLAGWRKTLLFELDKIESDLIALRKSCIALGWPTPGNKRFEKEKPPLGARKLIVQRKLSYVNNSIKSNTDLSNRMDYGEYLISLNEKMDKIISMLEASNGKRKKRRLVTQ